MNDKGDDFIMNIILYSTNCPKCNVLKTKLIKKGIHFTEINDIDTMLKKGYMQAPMLEVDNETMDFIQANHWINNLN